MHLNAFCLFKHMCWLLYVWSNPYTPQWHMFVCLFAFFCDRVYSSASGHMCFVLTLTLLNVPGSGWVEHVLHVTVVFQQPNLGWVSKKEKGKEIIRLHAHCSLLSVKSHTHTRTPTYSLSVWKCRCWLNFYYYICQKLQVSFRKFYI